MADLPTSVVNKFKSKPIRDGHAEITLRRGVLASETLTVARAWYDESLFRSRLNAIYQSVNIQTRSNQTLNIRCAPPIDDVAELSLLGFLVESSTGGKPSLIVLSVLASDEPMPFHSLTAHIDQTDKSLDEKAPPLVNDDPDNEGEGIKLIRSTVDFEQEFIKLDGNETTPGSEPPIVAAIKLPVIRFTSMSEQPTIIRRLSTAGKKKTRLLKDSSTKKSTARGKLGGDADNRQTDITNPHGNYSDSEDQLSPSEAITSVIEALNVLREHEFTLTSRTISGSTYQFRDFILNEVPSRPNSRKSWTYLFKGSMRRAVLIVELELEGNYSYVLEIIRNPGDQFSTLVFCQQDLSRVADDALVEIFRLLDLAQQLPEDNSVRAALGKSKKSENPSSALSHGKAKRIRHGNSDSVTLAERLASFLLLKAT